MHIINYNLIRHYIDTENRLPNGYYLFICLL